MQGIEDTIPDSSQPVATASMTPVLYENVRTDDCMGRIWIT